MRFEAALKLGFRATEHGVEVSEAFLFQIDGAHGPVRFCNVHREDHVILGGRTSSDRKRMKVVHKCM